MKKYYKLLMIVAITCFSSAIFAQGVTTSGINGKIIDEQGVTLLGATVVLTEVSTGSIYGTITDEKGNFHIPNVNVGGPYTLKISFVGYHEYEKTDIYLILGQTTRFNTRLQPSTTTLATVEIVSRRSDVFNGSRTGAETFINSEKIDNIPTLTGSLNDFTRLTPQANIIGSGISIAGMNNRYNAVFIDGTAANDVFGLAANGMNGGQTGISAISNETIKQFQIMIAPFDVRQSGFAGASINAVTKNGTNEFDGSIYFKFRNQDLTAKHNGNANIGTPEKLASFTKKTYGINLGGPIIKNKLFFYLNAEKQKDQTPRTAILSDYRGDASTADLDALANYMMDNYGYDAGNYESNISSLEGEKFLLRLDYNINKNHKLMARYQYTNAENISPSTSGKYSILYGNAGVYFPSKTHSFAFELKSAFGNKFSNNLKIGYTSTIDDRGPMGDNFPRIELEDGSGTIILGGEVYSSGNKLDQKIFTITDNFQIYSGDHTFTIGTHNEFYSIYNMFMRRAFGYYSYDEQGGLSGMERFMQGFAADYYRLGYSLVDDIRGDGSAAAADFNFYQLGAYVQDDWQVNENFKLTMGIRVDVPVYTKDPTEIPGFNETSLAAISAVYDTKGALSGKMPSTQLLWSPRVGFTWDVNGDKTVQIRGGTGVFTSRTPFVWPAGSYTNNGMLIGDFTAYDSEVFNPNWQTQTKGGDTAPKGGQVDLYAKNFKNPQVWRTNLAVDFKLPYDIEATAEFIYTKVLNNVLWKDINIKPAWGYATGTPDNRPLYRTYKNGIDSDYGQIMLGDNTDQGYSWTASLLLNKRFNANFDASLSYTYGKATSVFDGTSSQNSSQWNYLVSSPVPKNSAEVGISGFDMGHRIVAFATYKKDFIKDLNTSLSAYYNGQSGSRVSYIYDDYYGDLTSEAYKGPELIYIPQTSDEIVFIGSVEEQAAQWTMLDSYIENNAYLKEHRGEYAEKNGSRLPFSHMINLKFTQDLFASGNRNQKLQFSVDIFNFANMLNKNWGAVYSASNGNLQIMEFERMIVDPNLPASHELFGQRTLPTFSYVKPRLSQAYNLSDVGSRWQMMFTIRYIF